MNDQFCSALINHWFDVEQIDPTNPQHQRRLQTYRKVLDISNGLFAWNGQQMELISPDDAHPNEIMEKYTGQQFFFVKPKYSY